MRAWTASVGFALAVGATSIGAEARADDSPDAQARELYQRGSSAFDAGRFADALEHFEHAYELSPRPALLYNIGTSADRLRRNQRALEAFEAYLAAVPDAEQRDHVQARLVVLREAIAHEAEIEEVLRQEARSADADNNQADRAEAARTRRKRRILGGAIGGAAVVGIAILIGVLAGGRPAPFEQGDHGVVFTLSTP